MKKSTMQGKEGIINYYAFRFIGLLWIVAFSETKWHAGEKYKKAPVWISKIRDEIPALFIWKMAIGCTTSKQLERSQSKNKK